MSTTALKPAILKCHDLVDKYESVILASLQYSRSFQLVLTVTRDGKVMAKVTQDIES